MFFLGNNVSVIKSPEGSCSLISVTFRDKRRGCIINMLLFSDLQHRDVGLSSSKCLCRSTEATEEVSLDSPERDILLSDGPSPAITPITPPTSVITPRIGLTHDDMFTHSSFDEVHSLCSPSFSST